MEAKPDPASAREGPVPYHTLELGPEFTTHGMFDLRPYVGGQGLPSRLDGLRVLEVGTWDGFRAFELERRAATVVALDLDDERETGSATALAVGGVLAGATWRRVRRGAGLLGSSVESVVCNVYDTLPEDLGQFDLVFCGSVLIHLRDQLLALERIAGLSTPRGRFVFAEEYDLWSGLVPFPVSRYRADRDASVMLWQPSVRTWKRMLWTAGFDRVEQVGRFRMRSNDGWWGRHVVLTVRCRPSARNAALKSLG